jgi:hypothetical protein
LPIEEEEAFTDGRSFHKNKTRNKKQTPSAMKKMECLFCVFLFPPPTYFCQAARMKMAEKATRPMKDRKPMPLALLGLPSASKPPKCK